MQIKRNAACLSTALTEVADLLSARDKLAEQLAARQANVEAQNQRLCLVEARYKADTDNHLEVLDTQREAYAAEQVVVQVRRAALSAAAQLYKALAGETGNSEQGKAQPDSSQ